MSQLRRVCHKLALETHISSNEKEKYILLHSAPDTVTESLTDWPMILIPNVTAITAITAYRQVGGIL